MAVTWNPQKNIPLYTTNNFKAVWKTVIDEPKPGMLVGTGWLTPSWINFRGHNEKEYQECVIYHWPREIIPSTVSEKDKIADLLVHIREIVSKAAELSGIKELDVINNLISICTDFFNIFTSGPVGGLPLFKLANPDGSLTFIYAHWYEGTPQNLQWVLDFNWERYNRLRVLNQQICEMESDLEMFSDNFEYLEMEPSNFASSLTTKRFDNEILAEDANHDYFQTLEGKLVKKISINGRGSIELFHPTSNNKLTDLKSSNFDISRIPDLLDDNIIQVVGYLSVGNHENLEFDVHNLFIIKDGNSIYSPPFEYDFNIILNEITTFNNKVACPIDVKNRILKEVAIIKDASEKLNKIEWKKYGTIALGVGSLLAVTISAAIGILSTTTVAGSALATYILRTKVISLLSTVSALHNLDGWANAEINRMKSSKDLIESLKRSHPECFRD
ncbi:hypothetical protein FLAVO9AF_640008 [Flavobacterium sp. 9AF]|uniref:hypothetical protein n=1 Tax=Flavobacterium sp. 9AF TaxID=2653142 RepID=UPI0012F31655|nr:hypothetical protein [Flavobacterium sp. 9AF]VXC16843.1 hypothetical protein FLAVO9AF_640008 [Flavobacterium sp. 9AF]